MFTVKLYEDNQLKWVKNFRSVTLLCHNAKLKQEAIITEIGANDIEIEKYDVMVMQCLGQKLETLINSSNPLLKDNNHPLPFPKNNLFFSFLKDGKVYVEGDTSSILVLGIENDGGEYSSFYDYSIKTTVDYAIITQLLSSINKKMTNLLLKNLRVIDTFMTDVSVDDVEI